MIQRVLTKEIEEIARIELNETSQIRQETLQHMEEWIKKQSQVNLNTGATRLLVGLRLLNFLRGCKFSTQKAKDKLEAFLKVKHGIPEIFSNRDPFSPPLHDLLKNGCLIPFGTPDKDCFLFRWEVCNSDAVSIVDIVKYGIMLWDIFLNESETWMAIGHYAIIDCKGFSFAIVAQHSPVFIKRILVEMLKAYPLRMKGFYFINCTTAIETFYNLCKSVLSEKLQSRIFFYGNDYSGIFDSIPKKYFPREYGGCNSSLHELTEVWKNKVESLRQWFLDDVMCPFGSENLVLNNEFSDYGTNGSFRKLSFD
ncbi:hypothetical protein FQR65_LT09938 [Abscondita terminalis]|nr:hypothetical protein FQR65_LT09938 [Abscondita terminalis]